ncbi:hypothetical protein F4861DRAFT_518447 [Xylaria intraflava]|nr:hypothetical protein F4861DRAFT_518447 [Xylaria intraflava]
MLLLTDLPPEIIHHMLGYVEPQDLARIPRICKTFYSAVKDNTTLFKRVYLNHLDEPSQGPIDWERSLKDVVRLLAICKRPNAADKKDELDFVHRTVTELLKNASTDAAPPYAMVNRRVPYSRNANLLTGAFGSESTRLAFLWRSFIYERARAEFIEQDISYWHGPPKPEHQKSAHLHCLYGIPQLYAYPSGTNSMLPFACSKVYDLRQYTQKTKWGPFVDDDSMRVDWEKVEAIMIITAANLDLLDLSTKQICENWSVAFSGPWPNSWKSPQDFSPPREPDPLELLDPYGVTGVWLRVVCFLDYTDFFGYNFGAEDQPPPHVPRPALHAGEALRLLLMTISVTSIEEPGPEDGKGLPVVHFKGVSRGLEHLFDENSDSELRGTVRLTPEGEVRWTTYSIFGGVERWRSESIQVGGVKSARGVVGHWFDKDFDPRGPAGPTVFWKLSDENRPSHCADIHASIEEALEERNDSAEARYFDEIAEADMLGDMDEDSDDFGPEFIEAMLAAHGMLPQV